MPFGIKTIFELKAFEFLKSLICLKAERHPPTPPKNATLLNPLLGQLYNLLFWLPTQTPSQMIISPIFSPKGPFIFQKVTCFSINALSPPYHPPSPP